jgi:hypothetical protein
VDVSAYFESLSNELRALQNRVRYLIDNNHWQTDGEWKESVLRATLRRHLPSTVEVGRGFVLNEYDCSNQIDVLIYDSSKPILYRDGDLVFITADAVKGIIEVKSTISSANLSKALSSLACNAEFIRTTLGFNRENDLFVGLFGYHTLYRANKSSSVLRALKRVTAGNPDRVVNHICLGYSLFFRFWKRDPDQVQDQGQYNRWHSYEMHGLNAGYFINNVIGSVAGSSVGLNRTLWFPREGKEITRRNTAGL